MDAIRMTVRSDRLGLVRDDTQTAALLVGLEIAIHVNEDGEAWLQGVEVGDWLLMTPGRWVVTAVPL
jgi:hypothetical protein